LANALHFLPHGTTAHHVVGVKLYPHRRGIEVIETDLNLDQMLLTMSLNLDLAKV
jgi:hypothetical protein